MEINSELTSTSSEDYSKKSDSGHTFKVTRNASHTTKSSKENSLQSEETNDKILGIHLHKTSGLPFSKHLKHPRIKCSLYDPKTGELAKKSNSEKNVVLNLEPNDLDFILPVISKECKIDAKLEIFSNETIIINESIDYLKTSEFIIFLEIIDIELKIKKEKRKRVFNGWRYFCWAFAAINSKFLEFDNKIILQCYKFKKQVKETSAFDLWSSGYLKKYPASMVISLKGLEPKFISIGLTRPSTSLERDKLDIIHRRTSSLNSDQNSNLPEFDFIVKKINNSTEIIYAETLSGGSTICSISPNGDFVAYTIYEKRVWNIIIVDLRNFKKIQSLRGHQLTIYKLNWLFSKEESINYLVSCSEDKSCIVWRLKENYATMTHVLPHPYFMYTAKFIASINKKSLLVITGGFDKVLRIWNVSKDDEISSILQELSGHKTYVIDVFHENINNRIYSVEAYGTIIEWICDEEDSLWILNRTIAKLNYLLKQLHFQPNLRNLYVLHNDTIVKIDLSSGWQQNILDQHIFTEKISNFTLSNCGTFLYLANGNKIIFINLRSDSNTNKNIQIPRGNYEVSWLDCNAKNNLMAVSLNNANKEGGFYIYTINNKNNELLINNNKISNRTASQLSSRSLPANNNNKNEFSNDVLNEALKKLDKIIHKIALEKEVIHAIESRIKEKELSSEKSSSVNVNKTYSVTNKSSADTGTFTVKKKKDKSAQNTFTIASSNNNTDSDISEL